MVITDVLSQLLWLIGSVDELEKVGLGMMDAIVAGLFTVAAAVIGALVVMHQVRSQAAEARTQMAEAERLRLNLRIYDEVTSVVSSINRTSLELSSAMSQLGVQIDHANSLGPPKLRFLEVSAQAAEAGTALVEAIEIIERWGILDQRLDVFQVALNVAGEDLRSAFYRVLSGPLVTALPVDLPQGTHWIPPDAAHRAALEEGIVATQAACSQAACFAMDFQVAMQNLLLSKLGSARTPIRRPLDPDLAVITLEDRDTLIPRLEGDTAFGHAKRRAEADALEHLRSRQRS